MEASEVISRVVEVIGRVIYYHPTYLSCMECFSELVKMYIAKGEFDFHPKCKEIYLVNLNFANDLFIVCGATEVSLKLIRRALRMFGDLSGLHLNSSKSFCHFAGESQAKEKKLCEILGISASTLPVKYLGTPLTTRQLKASHYKAAESQ
ncbi:hypothetical protein LIER_22745 [Lithospermum erythrorhizon]|uniref:Reverse transcriptase n=1 Tax=Lithospermum erythrorhizon TaxID=34254 RepID=A0AAV3QXZ4_LITER